MDETPQPAPGTTPAPASRPEDVPGWAAPQMPPSGGLPTAPTGGMAPPAGGWAAPRTSRLGRWRGLVIVGVVVLFVVVVGAGVAVFRDQLSANAGDLRVGDCFDLPADAAASSSVGDVQHHPCTQAHGGEVFAVLTYPATASDTYPPTDAFDTFAADRCAASFQAYTGVAFDNATTLDAGYFFPLDSGWTSGDRTVICYLVDAAGKPLTSSMKSPAP